MQELIFKDYNPDKFSITTYPDCQRTIQLDLEKISKKESIHIKCRICHFYDFEILMSLMSALKINDFYVERLSFIYLMGMRSDRAFNIGEPNYFRDVISPIINFMRQEYNIPYIDVLGPHNINQLKSIDCVPYNEMQIDSDKEKDIIIGGDASVKNWCNHLDNYFLKKRCPKTGEISVSLNEPILHENLQEILIIDDLCDAGGTFIASGKMLKSLLPNVKLRLFIYHALFSKGVDELLKYYDEIITTNSYNDIQYPNVRKIEVI